MKSLFYLSLMAAGMLAVHANGQSLYTLAGPVGLEESLPLKWTFNLAGGYDATSTLPTMTSRKPLSSARTSAPPWPTTIP